MSSAVLREQASKSHRDAESGQPDAVLDDNWSQFVEKAMQSALLLVGTKLVSAWIVAALWPVPIRSRMAWGFVPYAGLETTAEVFRTVAAWSTSITAMVAIIWTGIHLMRQARRPLSNVWGAFLSLPMAALLAVMEWWRRFDADHLIPGRFVLWILLALSVAAVLFAGFVDSPAQREERRQPPQIPARPDSYQAVQPAAEPLPVGAVVIHYQPLSNP